MKKKLTTSSKVFPGSKVERKDPRYPTLIRGFNLRWKGKPSYIQVVGGPEQVQKAVQKALDEDRRITVRGGGHCYEDFVSANDGGVIIDLSAMASVFQEKGNIVVEGGATLWNVYYHMYKNWGLTIPGGSCYSVGAGGHIVGGGYGLLSRLHGLTIDYLSGVEVVVVNKKRKAEIIRVWKEDKDKKKRDLFWAHTGGGGGNFGVVTKYFFSQPPQAPKYAYLANIAWNWDGLSEGKFQQLVQQYGEFFARHQAADREYDGLFGILHLSHKSAQQIVLTAQYVGKYPAILGEFMDAMRLKGHRHEGQRYTVGWHHHLGPDTSIRHLPWLYAAQSLNASGPNQRGKYKSAYMREPFPEKQISTAYKWLSDPNYNNSQALLQVDSYGGKVNAVPPKATAVVQRSSILKLQYQTYWLRKGQDAYNLNWIRGFYTDMYGENGPMPDETMDGCFINYPDTDLNDWQTLYYGRNYKRLQKVKTKWDPHNIFNHKQSIEPLIKKKNT